MQSIWPFLIALAHSNGLAFLFTIGFLVGFIAPFIWRARRAERRYLSQFGTEVSESGTPSTAGRLAEAEVQAQDATHPPQAQEGGQDGSAGLSVSQSTQ